MDCVGTASGDEGLSRRMIILQVASSEGPNSYL